MFRGVSAINLDTKGRIAIPTRYRSHLDEQSQGDLIITVADAERCLWAIPLNEWEKIEKKLIALPSLNPQAQRLKRLLIGNATDINMDKSGRLLIPPPLREFAGLDKHVTLIGQGNKFEIWNASLWDAKCNEWLNAGTDESGLSIDLESLSL